MNHLHPKAKLLFFWTFVTKYLVIFGIIFFYIIGSIAPLLFRGQVVTPFISLILIFGSLFSLLVFFLYLWAIWTYNNYRYQLTEDVLKIERGVIWKKYSSVPYERIQNVDIHRGILDRLLGLSDLQIQTAGYSGFPRSGRGSLFGSLFGGEHAVEGRLPGLDTQTAGQLREELIKRTRGTKQGL